METQYYQVLISAETTAQGLRILESLMAKQLVLGGPVFNGPPKFLWNFKSSSVPEEMQKDELRIDEHDYCYAITFTREDLKQQLIEEAEKTSVEQVCMISFVPMEGNASLIKLLEDTFAGRDKPHAPPKPVDAVAALTFVQSKDIPFRTRKSADMSTNLPEPVATYFSANNRHDIEAMLVPFATDAVVKDEGQEKRGRAAIREWMNETMRRSQPVLEVAEIVNQGSSTIVTASVSTKSGGTPVGLRFAFKLDGRQIARLEIS
jgi:hypothetical protein